MVSLRIYKGKALTAPGVEYKSVAAHPGSTARKVIQRALKRFDDNSNPDDFRLQFVKVKCRRQCNKRLNSVHPQHSRCRRPTRNRASRAC